MERERERERTVTEEERRVFVRPSLRDKNYKRLSLLQVPTLIELGKNTTATKRERERVTEEERKVFIRPSLRDLGVFVSFERCTWL